MKNNPLRNRLAARLIAATLVATTTLALTASAKDFKLEQSIARSHTGRLP